MLSSDCFIQQHLVIVLLSGSMVSEYLIGVISTKGLWKESMSATYFSPTSLYSTLRFSIDRYNISIGRLVQWLIEKFILISAQFIEQYLLDNLTDYDVLARLHAVSLNYRDVAIPKVRLSTSL
jgi:hypothetical protein